MLELILCSVLQGGFPAVFPLLPDLTILQMFDNRFTCAIHQLLLSP